MGGAAFLYEDILDGREFTPVHGHGVEDSGLIQPPDIPSPLYNNHTLGLYNHRTTPPQVIKMVLVIEAIWYDFPPQVIRIKIFGAGSGTMAILTTFTTAVR